MNQIVTDDLWKCEFYVSPLSGCIWSEIRIEGDWPSPRVTKHPTNKQVSYNGKLGMAYCSGFYGFKSKRYIQYKVHFHFLLIIYIHEKERTLSPMMVVFGGMDIESNPLNDLWLFDVKSGSWEEAAIEDGKQKPMYLQ